MNASEIASVARAAGFPESSIPLAVAVALAESSGNPRAYNGRGADQSYGLWQINMIGSLGPARRAQFGLSRNEDLYDPLTNARAALAISGGGANWHPWSTYTNGSYKRYLSSASSGASSSSADVISILPPVETPFGQINPLWIGAAILVYLLIK